MLPFPHHAQSIRYCSSEKEERNAGSRRAARHSRWVESSCPGTLSAPLAGAPDLQPLAQSGSRGLQASLSLWNLPQRSGLGSCQMPAESSARVCHRRAPSQFCPAYGSSSAVLPPFACVNTEVSGPQEATFLNSLPAQNHLYIQFHSIEAGGGRAHVHSIGRFFS